MPRVAASKREEHAEARCEQILEAALRVFSRRGFAEATMEEVAAEAGLAKGSLYLYFASKEAVLDQILVKNLIFPGLADVLAPLRELSAGSAIPRLVSALWNQLKTRKAVAHLLTREIFSRPERARLYHEQVRLPALRTLAECLANWMDRGEISRGDPMALAQCLFGMLWYCLQTQELMGEEAPLSDQAVENTVAGLFLHGTVGIIGALPAL
jgi:AcrR family transcriptional regulator